MKTSKKTVEKLLRHLGHSIEIVACGGPDGPRRVAAVKCMSCDEVLLYFQEVGYGR